MHIVTNSVAQYDGADVRSVKRTVNIAANNNSISLDELQYMTVPFNRRHLSCDDRLKDMRKDNQNSSVLYFAPQLYIVI